MSLFSRLLQALDSWRIRPRGPKTAKRASVTIEQLDHRQLLSANFTGNVPIDFPATTIPGVVVLPGSATQPTIAPTLQSGIDGGPVINSGFAISDIRVSYSPTDDTLSFGFSGPPAGPIASPGNPNLEVIAGDADDSGNSSTVNPNVTALGSPFNSFQDFADFGGSEYMGAFLNFTGSGNPNDAQIVAGFSQTNPTAPTSANPNPQKPYEVALAQPGNLPNFGAQLPQFAGNVYTNNSLAHPNLEFSIKNFSVLYDQMTGATYTPAQLAASSATIDVGGIGGSANDTGIGEVSIAGQIVSISAATPPPANPEPSPPILINPHEHRIIDTGHRDLVRVSIFGTSGFPVSQINPATVELNGAPAIAHITRKVHKNEFPFQTYVFVASQLDLPVGLTTATLTGETKSGVKFESQKDVLNLPHSAVAFGRLKKYMGNATYYERLAKLEATNPSIVNTSSATKVSLASPNAKAQGAAAIQVDYTPKLSAAGGGAKAESARVRPVISLKRAEAVQKQGQVPTRVRYSMEHHLTSAN